jgi:hypothetical protein
VTGSTASYLFDGIVAILCVMFAFLAGLIAQAMGWPIAVAIALILPLCALGAHALLGAISHLRSDIMNDDDIMRVARELDRRWPSMHHDGATILPLARDFAQTNSVRATLAKHLPSWDLDEPLPILLAALEAVS